MASLLALNPRKCVLIPIADTFCEQLAEEVLLWLRANVPAWAHFAIVASGKYLGFIMGPGVRDESWKAPVAKWVLRGKMIACSAMAPSIGTMLYNERALPVLGYVAQVIPAPGLMFTMEMRAANK
eukprot:2999317-Heterocapsa_arctica.AAC.1